MAKCFPSRPVSGTPLAEIKVFDALASLPDPWMIFHSVGWQSLRGGRQGDGETDFVALHPDHGLVLIEVKGGRISIESGQWHSVNARTGEKNRIKDPFKQATDAKYALLRYLDQLSPPMRAPFICHAVALPGGTISGALSPAAPRATIIDGVDLTEPAQTMSRVLKHWGAKAKLSRTHVEQIKNLLAPTTQVRRTLRMTIAESTQQLLDLTDGQVRALAGLRRNRRALIYGGAGSGKTVLAVERAKSLSREGFKVLLTCYNRPLGDYLIDQVADDEAITARSFHALCMSEAGQAGLRVPPNPDRRWWAEEAPEVLVSAATSRGAHFDAVVVDEGQDFSLDWFEALIMLLTDPDEGPFYVFADTQQAIYTRGWKPPGDWAAFDLDVNCRNTLQIAERVAGVFGGEVSTLGAEGTDPLFVLVDSDEDALGAVRMLVKRLMKDEMLNADQIAVISPSRDFIDALYEIKIGSTRFVTFPQRGLIAETLFRFKGMEADVALVDLRGVDLAGEHGRGLAYVAMSRARAFLLVLGSADQARALGWPKKLIMQPELSA